MHAWTAMLLNILLLLLAVVLAAPEIILGNASAGLGTSVDSTGFLVVHKIGEGVYYVTVNMSVFKRVGSALVMEFKDEEEWLQFRCKTLPWMPVLQDLGLKVHNCSQAGLKPLACGEGNVTAGQPVEDPIRGLMEEAGVPYYRALIARVASTNTTLLVIRVPKGRGPGAASVAADARSTLEDKLGVGIDAVVVVETLWPPRVDAEAHARSVGARLGPALEVAWSAWRSHAGRVPPGAAVVAYSSGDPMLYLTIKVSKPRMQALKVSLDDVVEWVENVTGNRESLVVIMFDEEGSAAPLPLKPSHERGMPGLAWAAIVSSATAVGIAVLAGRRLKA
jgi:hypothetical protein